MNKLLIILSLLTLNVSAEIYQWKDKKGVTHYSDQYQKGSKEIKLPPAPTLSSPALLATPTLSAPATPVETKVAYKAFALLEPTPNQYVRDNQGILTVKATLEPKLKEGDTIQPLLDGKLFGPPQTNLEFSLQGIDRGEHSLKLQVLNNANPEPLIETNEVPFFLQRHSKNFNN